MRNGFIDFYRMVIRKQEMGSWKTKKLNEGEIIVNGQIETRKIDSWKTLELEIDKWKNR